MLTRLSRHFCISSSKVNFYATPAVSVPARFDSGIGNALVKNLDVVRKSDRISELLNKVRDRDGLPKQKSHVEHLVGRLTKGTADERGSNEMAGLDIGDKTEIVLQSTHPVRHTLEREIYNNSRNAVSYHNWLTLFGRGIQVTKNPKYEEILDFISKASDSGMFSSDIHETVVNIPEDFKAERSHLQFSLGNKYSVLVGDYFAIRCIYFVEKTKISKVLMAITKGVEEYTTAHFASKLLDTKIIYPFLPHANARVNDWILYNRKASGYFNGGIYALLLVNYGKLPENQEFMKNLKLFSSNLSVLLRGLAELEEFEHVEEFSTISPHALISLPAILYQQKNPGVFDELRHTPFDLHKTDHFKKLTEDIEKNSAINEAKFILGNLALETKRSFEKISSEKFYSHIVQDLVDAVANFD